MKWVSYNKLPETIKKEIVDPYISVKDNEARINLRIKKEVFRKSKKKSTYKVQKVDTELKSEVGLNEKYFKLGGVLILFNNLLQSLFKSQITTLGLVMIGIF